MPPVAQVIRAPDSSRDLCRSAIVVYHDLFARLPWTDPDAGFGQVYVSGTRYLEARAGASEWLVPETTVHEVERLFESARSLPENDVADWICLYPRRFLSTVDRRRAEASRVDGGRRATDRVPVPVPRATASR